MEAPGESSACHNFPRASRQSAGNYDRTARVAIKYALAPQIKQAMKEANITKAETAPRMESSRSQLNRLLDPDTESVTLDTLARAAQAVGRRVRVEIV